MTKELAIKILTGDVLGTTEQTHEAIAMAVKALSARTDTDTISRQDAIDAVCDAFCYAYCDNCEKELDEDLCGDCHRKYQNWSASRKTVERVINALPSADAVEVVRCWNCVWWDNCPSSTITPNFHKCKRVGRMSMPSDGFCSYGEEPKDDK